MSMFIPLHKVEAAERMVYGRIDETPDRAGEIFDYESSKPEFQAWSNEIAKATDGKSLGNVRAMHSAIAAGKLDALRFDDRGKSIELAAKIVDDDEWSKIEAGVYTGFSPGGHYVKRWQDGEHVRYTARPVEISIVDLPCIPSATFTMVKADGVSVEMPFHAIAQTAGAGGEVAAEAEVPLSKALVELAGVRAEMVKLTDENARLMARLAELEAMPQPGGPALRAVSKGEDAGYSASIDEQAQIGEMPNGLQKSLALIKLAHRHPAQLRF